MKVPTYEERHSRRYAHSLQLLRPHLRAEMSLLECGSPGLFTRTLVQEFGVRVINTTWDLRYPFNGPALDGLFDVVVCMEVLEHIADQEPAGHEWRGTGARCLLATAFAALKPGGLLFLSTPNACSIDVLYKLLTLTPPMVYRPHVREYGPHELTHLVKGAGFERLQVTGFDSWDNDCMPAGMPARLLDTIQRLGFDPHCRAQNLFLTAHRPG